MVFKTFLAGVAVMFGFATAAAAPASAESMAEVRVRPNKLAWGEYAAAATATAMRVSGPSVSQSQAQIRNVARQAVLAKLRDPSSPQFRNVRRISLENGTSVFCGEVNGRNAFGGYAGFVRFEAGVRGDGDGFAQLDSQEAITRAYFQSSWNQICGRMEGVAVQF